MNLRRAKSVAWMILGGMLLAGVPSVAQTQGSQPAPTPAQDDKSKPSTPTPAPLTLDSTPPPVNAEEDAAIKKFHDAPTADVAGKDKMGEEFLQKYPQSRYRPDVYSWLVKGYLSLGQVDKMEAVGDKELELMPNDAQTLAIVGSTLPRAMSASTPDPEKRLAKAETYSKKALEIMPTYPKPENVSDEAFVAAKNQTMALAYSGLGIVAIRRGKFAEAIPNLEQSVKLDPNPDPVNYYLLGLANVKAAHFDDAVAAFTKCAAIPGGGIQATCKTSIDDAKKQGATQLSAPK
jgi:tetratricopeptide (TPR) repeat protein